MIYGAVVRAPVEGSAPDKFDEAKVRAIAGVIKTVNYPTASVWWPRRHGRRSRAENHRRQPILEQPARRGDSTARRPGGVRGGGSRSSPQGKDWFKPGDCGASSPRPPT